MASIKQINVGGQAYDLDTGTAQATVTLAAAAWADNTQTVAVAGATTNNIKIISPAYPSIDEYATCGVKAAAEGEGTITFACNTAPENDLAVNVAILGV